MGDRRGQYLAELRQRAVRLVAESKGEYESEWAAITSIAAKLGIGNQPANDPQNVPLPPARPTRRRRVKPQVSAVGSDAGSPASDERRRVSSE